MIAALPGNLAPLSSNMRIADESAKGVPTKHVNRPRGYIFAIGAPRNFSSRELVNLRGHADPIRVQGSLEELGPAGRRTRNEEMLAKERGCALLADRHLGLAEGIRGLLETEFEAVVGVGDEVSLFESARQLHVALAVVDLSLRRGDGLGLIRRIRSHFPQLKLIALSVHEDKNAEFATIKAGANGFVLKRSIATDLLPTIDAVLARSAT
jgi:CheY-like chemotaxis protein